MTAPSLCDRGPAPRPPERFNLAAHTLAAAEVTPDKVALTVMRAGDDPTPERMTYADLRDAVLRVAGGLRAAGVAPGNRVVLRIGHSSDFPVTYLACAALGAVAVPTSTTLSGSELAHIVAETEASLIVVSDGMASGQGREVGTMALRDASPLDRMADTAAEDLASIVYTSGSSGHPKGVAHAHRAAYARRMMWEGWYGLSAADTVLHAGAFNWTFTLGTGIMDPWAAGASAVIYAGPRDPGVWPALVAASGATIFAAAPGVYRQLLKSGVDLAPLSALRHGLSAGEPMAQPVRAAWEAATGTAIHNAYGMTECSTFVSSCPADPTPATHAGTPQPGRVVAVLPVEDGAEPVPLGEVGQIAVHRSDPGMMLGYWARAEETEAAMRGDWFVTGDLGAMDARGAIRFEGRADDQMNALGYRVAPQEVEAALMNHPDITGVAAVELPVRADLSVIAAFVTCAGDFPGEAVLKAHCAGHLADYKIPKIVRPIEALPRNANGKLVRRRLIEIHGTRP